MSKPLFAYWDVRGLAEPIKYLLHYKNIDFEEKIYPFSDMKSWQDVKFTLGLDFPNLPYYIDEDVKLTQSTVILRYLAAKYDLNGKTQEQRLRMSLAEQQIVDYRTKLIGLVYNERFDELVSEFIGNIPEQLQNVSNFLGDRKYIAGDDLTYVDFMAFEIIDFFELLIPIILTKFTSLSAYQERIRSLPSLKKYLESDSYKKWPIFAPFTKFGGQGPYPKQD